MTKISENHVFWEWMKILLVALLLIFVVRAFLFTAIQVKGASMAPTLHNKDRMIVMKLGKPERFDIIVFHGLEGEDYIKRVIGLPGDQIEYRNDTLYINEEPYEEAYLEETKQDLIDLPLTGAFTLQETPVGTGKVPEGHLFVMGDNRRHSMDSRHFGAIPVKKVIGTTNIVYFPFTEIKIIR